MSKVEMFLSITVALALVVTTYQLISERSKRIELERENKFLETELTDAKGRLFSIMLAQLSDERIVFDSGLDSTVTIDSVQVKIRTRDSTFYYWSHPDSVRSPIIEVLWR